MQLDLSHFWHLFNIPEPQKEYKFHPTRKWRFDWAWPERKIGLEVDGGLWIGGRHNRPVTMIKDNEKFNQAALLGWKILKFTPQQFKNGEAAELLAKIFADKNIYLGELYIEKEWEPTPDY